MLSTKELCCFTSENPQECCFEKKYSEKYESFVGQENGKRLFKE